MSSVKTASTKKKIDSFQALRAIAFVDVFLLHCGEFASGAAGVSIFFILSGFLMYYSYCEKSLDTSIKNSVRFSFSKINKLYSLHILMLLASFAVLINSFIKNFTIKSLILEASKFITQIFLVQSWVPNIGFNFSFNSVAWYLSVCCFLYACFPSVLKKIKKFSTKVCAIFMFLIFGIQILVGAFLKFSAIWIDSAYVLAQWVTYIFPVARLGDFIIGCCLGKIFLNHDFNIGKLTATFLEALSFLMFIAAEYIFASEKGILGTVYFKYTVIFTPISVLLVFLFAINKGYISRCLTCKPLIFLGDISAYTFLIHQIVIRYIGALNYRLIHLPDSNLTTILKVVSSFIISILFAVLYRAVERKIREKRRSVKKI